MFVLFPSFCLFVYLTVFFFSCSVLSLGRIRSSCFLFRGFKSQDISVFTFIYIASFCLTSPFYDTVRVGLSLVCGYLIVFFFLCRLSLESKSCRKQKKDRLSLVRYSCRGSNFVLLFIHSIVLFFFFSLFFYGGPSSRSSVIMNLMWSSKRVENNRPSFLSVTPRSQIRPLMMISFIDLVSCFFVGLRRVKVAGNNRRSFVSVTLSRNLLYSLPNHLLC